MLFLVASRCYAQNVLGGSGLTTAGYHTGIVAPDQWPSDYCQTSGLMSGLIKNHP